MVFAGPFNEFELPNEDRLQPQCRMSDYAASGVARVVITASSVPFFRHNQTEYASEQIVPRLLTSVNAGRLHLPRRSGSHSGMIQQADHTAGRQSGAMGNPRLAARISWTVTEVATRT
jgi:hypothetical protein